MCEGGKKKKNIAATLMTGFQGFWLQMQRQILHTEEGPCLCHPWNLRPPPPCGWTLLTRQPLMVHLLILRRDWRMKDSALTVNLSILMWPPVQWKVERARMLTGGGLACSVTHANTWAAIILDHLQLFLCSSVNFFFQHNLSKWTPISHIFNKKG